MQNPASDSLEKVIKSAGKIALKYGSSQVGTEHLLYGLTAVKDCMASKILKEYGITSESMLETFEESSKGVFANVDVELTPKSKEIIGMAKQVSSQLGHTFVGPEHLLFALLSNNDCFAVRLIKSQYKANLTDIKSKLILFLQASADFNLDGNNQPIKSTLPEKLLDMGYDITLKARQNKIDPIIGREEEIQRIIEILCRKTKNNPILIGEAGVGKTAVVEGLAQAIVNGNVPDELKDKIIYSMEIGGLMAGTKYRGSMEEKLKDAIETIIASKNIIVFIDEIHTLAQAGSEKGETSPKDMLKPYLARGELQTIGATTTDEFRKFIESDKALERRFQPIIVNPPSVEQTIEILKGIRDSYETFHKVKISDEAIEAAATLSDRYITDRSLPDKAIDLVDEASSKAKVRGKTDYIGANDIAEVVSKWTGIPVTKINETEKEKLINLENILHMRVVGQENAVNAVAKAIRRSRVGLHDSKRPIGSFLFMGQTGVGKTELCKAIAEAMFNDENNIIRIDMSEYMEPHSVAKLIGAPPGYVGYDEGGQLTEQVRRRPYSVVLFDEIEKAHPDIFNALLQVLDDGRLTDGQGRLVSFRNTIIIMTSNIGTAEVMDKKYNAEFDGEQVDEEEVYMEALRKRLKPEFINRIDVICVFKPLTKEDLTKIATIMVANINKRLTKSGLEIKMTARALDYIVNKGTNLSYGARPLKRYIQQEVEDRIAEKILLGQISQTGSVIIDAYNNELFFKSN